MTFNKKSYETNGRVESERKLFIVGGDLRYVFNEIIFVLNKMEFKKIDKLCRFIGICTYTELVKDNGISHKDATCFVSIGIIRKYEKVLGKYDHKKIPKIIDILNTNSKKYDFDEDYDFTYSYGFAWNNYKIMKEIVDIYDHDSFYDYDPKDVPYIISNYFNNNTIEFMAICCCLYYDVAVSVCSEKADNSWIRTSWENLYKKLTFRDLSLFKKGVFDIDDTYIIKGLANCLKYDNVNIDSDVINNVKKIVNKRNQNEKSLEINNKMLESLNLTISI